MKKYLAESTLKKKYRELGLSKDAIKKLHYYLLASVNLYGTLTQDEVWRVVKTVERRQRKGEMDSKLRASMIEAVDEYIYSVNGNENTEEVMSLLTTPIDPELTREQFDAFMEVASREQNMFIFNTEDQFYNDGKADVAYISDLKLMAGFGSIEDLYDRVDTIEDEDEEVSLKLDGFFAVNEARQGQTLIVPDDLLCYVCQTYYHMTEEADTIWNFLMDKIKSLTAVQASLLVFRFYSIVRNPLVGDADKVQEAVNCVEKFGHFRSSKEIEEFAELLYRFANNTRLMEYKGQSPADVSAVRVGAVPQKNAAAGSSLLFNDQAMKAVQEVLKPGETKVINKGGTVIKGKKIGPNEPCPCGSGKKYKKCCGKVVNND